MRTPNHPEFHHPRMHSGEGLSHFGRAPVSSQPLRNGPPGNAGTGLFPWSNPVSSGRHRFVVLGDTGGGGDIQQRIAEQLRRLHGRVPFDTVLMLGDNVYPNGDPALFDERIDRPYRPLREQGVQFRPVLGNHDVRGGHGDRQLAYWNVPPFYHFTLGPPENRVDFFALDTTVMLAGALGCHTGNREAAQDRARRQMAWLEQALAKSTAHMKVVFGHYPVYSGGLHGLLETVHHDFKEQLEPVLARYGVDLYLSGHEHFYEWTDPIRGVHYMVSGAGGRSTRQASPWVAYPRRRFLSRNHLVLFEATGQGLAFQVLDAVGRQIDAGLIPKRR